MTDEGFKGKKNVYTCKQNHRTVTIDRDDGTTPFMIQCLFGPEGSAPVCKSMAESSFYRCDQSLVATHEWYKPSAEEMSREKRPAILQHVAMGGLLLRRIVP